MPTRDNDVIPDHWPDHEFAPHRDHPDLCVAVIEHLDEKGAPHMTVQCGHTRDAHPIRHDEAM